MADLLLIDLAVYSRMTQSSNPDSFSLPDDEDEDGDMTNAEEWDDDTEEWEDELPGEEQEDDE